MSNECGQKQDITELVKAKAKELWEKDGKKPGHDTEYWVKAEKIIKAQKHIK